MLEACPWLSAVSLLLSLQNFLFCSRCISPYSFIVSFTQSLIPLLEHGLTMCHALGHVPIPLIIIIAAMYR